MLKTLYAKNYALIEEATIEFSPGLNILTGETGAGKSILVDALGLILGERASTDAVRHGADKAIIEGSFTITGNDYVTRLLHDQGYDNGEELIVRREITARGTSRAFVNDSPAPLSLVRDIGDHLVDLHGQHEHQLLLNPETHSGMLDSAGGLEELLADYGEAYGRLSAVREELRLTREREAQLKERHDFYQYQLREIDAIDPQPGEDDAIQKELKILENAERIVDLTSTLHGLLYDDANSVRDQLNRARGLLDTLAAIDPTFAELRSECSSASVVIEEIAKSIHSYNAHVEFTPDRLESLRERLLKLSGLRKKFGGSLDAVIAYRDSIRSEVALAQNFDERIAEMERELETLRGEAGTRAGRLSKKRAEIAKKVERSIETTLKGLGIDKGRFVVHIEQIESGATKANSVVLNGRQFIAYANGIDRVEFYISTNLGEEPKPLARVASGGEVSRVMLALKTILAKNSRLPILVFDEIDTGISGRIASKVGAAMKNLAAFHQIVAITHLPQIAAMSANHFVVEKDVHGGRTTTRVKLLDRDEHTREVAKLMSGENITESSLQMARELIGT